MNVDRGFVTGDDLGLEEQVETAAMLGYDYVEISMFGADDRQTLAAKTGAVRDRLIDAGLDCLVHLPFVGIDIGAPHEHVREGALREIEAYLDIAADFGARKAVVHPESGADDPDDQRRLVTEGICRLDAYAADRGIVLCAENMPSHYVALDDIDHLLTDTDAMLTIDTGHARIAGYEATDLAEFLTMHGDRVSHFHLNDTAGPSDDHLSFGAGTIDFETIFEPLHRADWSGTLSVESKSCQPAYLDLSLQQLDVVLDSGR